MAPGLVVVVAARQDRLHLGQIDISRLPLLDQPRESAEALAV